MRLKNIEQIIGKKNNLIALSAGAEEAFNIPRNPKTIL